MEFDKFWLECEPKDIMEFNRIRDIFESNLRSQLQENNSSFNGHSMIFGIFYERYDFYGFLKKGIKIKGFVFFYQFKTI